MRDQLHFVASSSNAFLDNNEDADHRYLMFSATFPRGARALAKDYLDDDNIRIHVGRPGSTHKNITQRVSNWIVMLGAVG